MNAQETSDGVGPWELPTRLLKVLVYLALGSLVTWRAWTYQLVNEQAYPWLPMLMCAGLVAVLYTLSIVTLVGRSEVLAPVTVAVERDDSTRSQAGDRATA
jgi:hypothetical protein